jgi:hypothetical protein
MQRLSSLGLAFAASPSANSRAKGRIPASSNQTSAAQDALREAMALLRSRRALRGLVSHLTGGLGWAQLGKKLAPANLVMNRRRQGLPIERTMPAVDLTAGRQTAE